MRARMHSPHFLRHTSPTCGLPMAQYAFGVNGSGKEVAEEFLQNVETNTKQYLKLFAEAADDCLPAPSVPVEDDVYDVLQAQVRAA